jgi:hypothetical protein
METEQVRLSSFECGSAERCIAEARRHAREVEALLVEAASDPNADTYALHMAQGLARSLIDQLTERSFPSSRLQSRLARGGAGNGGRGNGSAQVA